MHYNIRATFGAAGDTMLVMSPETRESLAARRAKGDARPVDLIGILVRPPAPSAVPNWRRHVYCSLFQVLRSRAGFSRSKNCCRAEPPQESREEQRLRVLTIDVNASF